MEILAPRQAALEVLEHLPDSATPQEILSSLARALYPDATRNASGRFADIYPERAQERTDQWKRLHTFLEEIVLPQSRDWDEAERFPLDAFKQMHAIGFLQAAVPREYGGPGMSTSELVLASRALGGASAGLFTSFLGNLVGFSAIREAPEDLRRRLSEETARTFCLWSFCLTEPDSGTDISSIRTVAEQQGSTFRISGKKHLITNATYADHLIVFATIKDFGLTAFYVPSTLPGIERGPSMHKFALRASNTGELSFRDVIVPASNMLGQPGSGRQILERCIHRSKILIAAAVVGICDRAGQLAINYLSRRVLYARPLLSKSVIRNQLAEMFTEMEAAWLLAQNAAYLHDNGASVAKESAMAKLFATNMAVSFVTEALEFLGGYGVAAEGEIQRLYRDVRVFEIIEGASLVQCALIARALFPAKEAPTG